jgi:NTP pyrophosphatase (non-canonical NTP hydrolase)
MQRHIAVFDAERFESLGPGYLALSLAGEAGELANLVKKLWRKDTNIGTRSGFDSIPSDQRVLIADELADVMMLCVVLANHLDIDVEVELARKLTVIDERLQSGYYGSEANDGGKDAGVN